MNVLRAVRALARLPGFRRLTRVTPLLRLSFALRATLVEERLRFVLNELRPASVTRVYRLRGGGGRVALRHHTPDVLVLDEVVAQAEYEPPPAAERILRELAPLRVADLGANVGVFGAWLLGRFPHARIVAFEADAANAAIHARTIAANPRAEPWELVEAVAATADGRASFAPGSFATSRLALAGQNAIEVPTVDVFPRLAESDFLKIDIEGAEWPILMDPRFAELAAPVVVLEYHHEGCPRDDPQSVGRDALRRAGYQVMVGRRKPDFAAGLLWGVKDKLGSWS